ncbi:helix-turn-helix transcriptional regulator [Faecalispora anaeroviscerum]|uniref:helix-turn-helix transcriptional regulator n=1 Tax=Faecalispora anaeroviscerum TaxID=2991836 RepID=UPI0024B942E4|nr:WYL domain-containing protein [Faecalispora anaeroviscerum]
MPVSQNQKMKLLYLMRILLERTDADHTMTVQELIAALAEYGILAERKSVYSDLELLSQFGLDVESQRSRTVGYYIDARKFELPELKLLVDAVQSSRFITPKKSTELIQKLSALTSNPQASQLRRQVYVADRPKTINESIYYNIDAIHAAINSGCKISFQYFDYNTDKERVYRKDGERYCQSPMALCWDDDKYYLICYSTKYDDFAHYRVDRMCQVAVCEETADMPDQRRFNVAEHTKQVFGMYSGELVSATLRFDQSLVNAVLDRFGPEVPFRECGDSFEICVEVSNSPVFLSWIFQFGEKAEIVAPESLIASMQALLSEQAKKYR